MVTRVLVIGNSCMEFIQYMDRIPERSEIMTCRQKYRMLPGGRGTIAAITFSKLSGDTLFCTSIGEDTTGKRLKEIFLSEKIDTRFVFECRSDPTGIDSIINISPTDSRIIRYPSASKYLSEPQIEESFTAYPDCCHLILDVPGKAGFAASLCAEENNIPLFVDAFGVTEDLDISRIRSPEIFSANETESELITSIRPDTINNCLKVCIRIADATKAKNVVLKLGDRGCYVYDGKYSNFYSAYNVVVADTVSSGTIFSAALTLAYMQNGNDIFKAARFANAAAGYSVTIKGPIDSIPSLEQVTQFAKIHEDQDR